MKIKKLQDELINAGLYEINSYESAEEAEVFFLTTISKQETGLAMCIFCALVDTKLADRAFSPTAINTYLKCPRQYLYNNILDFKGKDGNPDTLSYGSAIHAACEFLINYAKDKNKYPTKDLFVEKFKTNYQNFRYQVSNSEKIWKCEEKMH